ncbi:MFS transporter [Nocardia seriolae]|uniref:MFS transporter n=1 Tax=Nocardia seriolae TaxID=37332 RepID=A0ABC9YWP6_9NOCA|nr:MFS transporter [Nocardia seriolae]BEK94652.1 MFS transporter [Nocardia seriolae]GAM47938.1 MFS transporter [Nocardia seriolae]GAP29802.1 MFS transporter [Nocardia seriolae]GEM25398.1 MFS transporter [Nocardia seriolae NBRC 15557]
MNSIAMSTAAPARSDRAGRREWSGLGVLALACLVYAMDLTVLHLAVPQISETLHPSSTQLLWIIDVYGFMLAGLLITMGTLGDRIGRRRLLLTGGALFGVVSVVAAFSPTAEFLIVCRALLGIAGATIAPSPLSLIFNMFRDPRQRSLAVGTWVSAFSAGGVVGPLLGGVLLEHFWWGSVFLLAVPVMVLLLILGPRVLPEFRDPEAGRLDLISAALSVVAMISLVLAMKQVAQDGVGPLPLAAIVVGLAAGALFVRRQLTRADPMLDLSLFRLGAFRTALGINVIAIFVAFGYFLFVAQYFQLVLDMTPMRAGVAMAPSSIGFIVGSQAAPRIVRVVRPAYLVGAGMILAAIGLVMLTRLSVDGGPALAVIASLLIALGLAPVFGITTELIVGSAPPEQAGAASGVSETGSELGGALDISILGSISLAIYRADLSDSLPRNLPGADSVRETLGEAVQVAATLPGGMGDAVLTAARAAFIHGVHITAGIAAVGAVAVAVLAVAKLRHVPAGELSGEHGH